MALPSSDKFHSSLRFGRSLSLPCARLSTSSLKFPKLQTASAGFTSTTSKTTSTLCSEMASSSSCYEVLGVPTSASSHEIKAAYRKLAKLSHPDVASNDQKQTSAEDFITIHAAYSTLSDPVTRANYDHNLYKLQWPFSPAMAARDSRFNSNPRGKWETDQCW